jgi:hypothetical protein
MDSLLGNESVNALQRKPTHETAERLLLGNDSVKYGRKSQGTRNRETLRWQGPAAYIKERPILSPERAPNRNKTVTVKEQ